MRAVRRLLGHPLTGPTIRYGIAGAIVAVVYLSLPVAMNAVLGISIEVAIPIAYVIAVTLHFNLQRHFVFGHVDRFALSTREQIARYVVVGAVQYPITALATALLPSLLDISARAAFLGTAIAISVIFYVVLRTRVFHAAPESANPTTSGYSE